LYECPSPVTTASVSGTSSTGHMHCARPATEPRARTHTCCLPDSHLFLHLRDSARKSKDLRLQNRNMGTKEIDFRACVILAGQSHTRARSNCKECVNTG
jgi:hypothetical protein